MRFEGSPVLPLFCLPSAHTPSLPPIFLNNQSIELRVDSISSCLFFSVRLRDFLFLSILMFLVFFCVFSPPFRSSRSFPMSFLILTGYRPLISHSSSFSLFFLIFFSSARTRFSLWPPLFYLTTWGFFDLDSLPFFDNRSSPFETCPEMNPRTPILLYRFYLLCLYPVFEFLSNSFSANSVFHSLDSCAHSIPS